MKYIILSLGGSVVKENDFDHDFLTSFVRMIEKNTKSYKFVIVVGGGQTAREYISYARKNGLDEYDLDYIGILATRMNSMVIYSLFKKYHNSCYAEHFADKSCDVLITGGTVPGHTTDAVALLAAEYYQSGKVINVTSVGGIYDSDPRINRNARIIENIDYSSAIRMFYSSKTSAGPNIVLDLLSLKIAERSSIEIDVVGKDVENIENAINGKKFRGTTVKGL
ncbi:MAG: UMP kinase [Thermoplasmata archaeon]